MSTWIPSLTFVKNTLECPKAQAGLYIVSTPIGNLGDITLRALHTLGTVDEILCEDTRLSGKLASVYEITTRRTPYHEHNAERVKPRILAALEEGQSIALISDAGTPLISDPGYKLVRAACQRGIKVFPIPGACSPIAALTVSGLPSDQFYFAGFAPAKASARRAFYGDLAPIKATLLIFETAARLSRSLEDLQAALGQRQVCVARELTKKFETLTRAPVSDLIRYYGAEGPPRGEIVLVVDGAPKSTAVCDQVIQDQLMHWFKSGLSLKDAVERVRKDQQLPRRRVYALALQIQP